MEEGKLWVLGAADPEMTYIEALLREAGQKVIYAAVGGKRVTPATAYSADPIPAALYWVECSPEDGLPAGAMGIDHHRPGDPGYGKPPEDYLLASSLGQVLALLGVKPSDEHRLVAAADHCLGAAYRGRCPGVDPDKLMRWRAESRARFQGRPVEALLADLEAARQALREAPVILLSVGGGLTARDLRGKSIPELPEAAAREGECFVAELRESGRIKVVCQGGTPEQIRAFIAEWAPAQGLTGIYGDPERGFAGGYREEVRQ